MNLKKRFCIFFDFNFALRITKARNRGVGPRIPVRKPMLQNVIHISFILEPGMEDNAQRNVGMAPIVE